MRKAGVVDSDLLEHMMGHHNLRLTHGGNYDEFDPDYIRKEYAKAEQFLTVTSSENSTTTSQAVRSRVGPNRHRERDASIQNRHQRIVDEEELEYHLANGWEYIATLPSGRLIVSG
jgi:hypothetical protein